MTTDSGQQATDDSQHDSQRCADPRDFGLTSADLHAVADRLYDCADSRLDPMDDVSVRFGLIRSHLRSLADAIDDES